jgi:hypothetical protein
MKRRREEWIEGMHRAPDVDWRQIEQENRRALSLERFARVESGQLTNQWTELGSANLAGRTMAAAPDGSGRLYIGSHQGGVWRGTTAGENWTAISDGLGLGSHQVLAVPQEESSLEPGVVLTLGRTTIYGTIHATTDGGANWFVPEGLPDEISEATRLVQAASDFRTIYLLCRGRRAVGGGGFEWGYFLSRSTDGGVTFEHRYTFPNSPKCDIWMNRVSGGDLFLLSGNTLHNSIDNGLTFQAVGSIPEASTSEVILTGSEAGAPTLYAAVRVASQWKIYRSADAGATWSWRNNPTIWWRTFNASIVDPDLVYFGEVHAWRSTNGGATFAKINDWTQYYGDPENKLHADIPGINIYWVDTQEVTYINTDGGTYVSYDSGLTVRNLSLWGLGVSEYYSTLTSATRPDLIAAGSQDQGYQVSLEGDIRGPYLQFEQLISGDYGHLTSYSRDHNWVYCVYPGFILGQMNENPPYGLFQLDFPVTDHLWMPPILADPVDRQVFYFCGDHIWKYTRSGNTQIHSRIELPHDFGSAVTGLAISSANPDYWHAATNVGLWYSHDGGSTWTETAHGPNPHYFYGTTLVASPDDTNLAYAGGSGYQGNPVWRTTDGGVTWTGMSDGLPSTLVYELALGGSFLTDLYAATESGPYGFNSDTGQWESLLGTEAPLTTYWTVEWVPEIQTVRFGTYGRGIWDHRPQTSADVAESQSASHVRATLDLFPTPVRDNFSIRFRTSEAGAVRIQLFDVTGRQLATFVENHFSAGTHDVSASLRQRPLRSGVYFVRMTAPDGVAVRKLQVVGGSS